MKIRTPFVSRKIHERVVFELEKDLNVKELTREAADRKVKELKDKLDINRRNSDARNENKNAIIAKLEAGIEEKDKQIEGMKWCIQERDKELEDVRAFNLKLFNKVNVSNEMYRQFKEKVDKACEIDFVTGVITPADIKKFMQVEAIVELYTLIGIAGK